MEAAGDAGSASDFLEPYSSRVIRPGISVSAIAISQRLIGKRNIGDLVVGELSHVSSLVSGRARGRKALGRRKMLDVAYSKRRLRGQEAARGLIVPGVPIRKRTYSLMC